ncbi:phytoene desaturase family protein [Aeromicrobium sp. CF3.5]|uniref:phytoene desaturase family protein n=1 Tax=Aeromicrobium sp. CF3.5 TaxID=3373078 RepID=UPI003EE7EA2B
MTSTQQSETTSDVVIVGGGHNGLVCAAYLGQAGHRVTVIERWDQVGGACVTDELWPGFKVSTASLVTTLFRREIIEDLELESRGLRIVPRDPSVTALFDDGQPLTLSADDEATAREIAKFSPRDAERYPEFGRAMRQMAEFVEPYFLGPAREPLLRDVASLKSALLDAAKLPDDELGRLVGAMFGSARDLLDSWFESEELKVTLATDGTVGLDAGPSMPGSAYLMLYHQLGSREAGRPAWGQVMGGMGSITQALAAACLEYDVTLVTGRAVQRIVTGSDGVEAVELDDGSRISTSTVVSGVSPRTTFLDLLGPEDVPSAYRHAIAQRPFPGVAAKVHLALDHLPDVRGFTGPGRHLNGTLQILPSMDHLDMVHAKAARGIAPERPHIECTIPSVLDPSMAPPGKHVLSMYVQYVPHTVADGNWSDVKEAYLDDLLEYVEPYLPGLTDAVIHRLILTPADLEERFALPGGNLYHGAMSPLDLFAGRPVSGYADHETPVAGLFLCGSGTRPGGGVFGVPGRNASAVVRGHLGDA